MMKWVIFSISCFVFVLITNAQITTDELPFGLQFESDNILRTSQRPEQPMILDQRTIQMEDAINDQEPGPLRFAYPIAVNYTLDNVGSWQKLPDGSKIWTLNVTLPGALSTNVVYDQFWLPEGTKFFVYNKETKQNIGAITSEYIGGTATHPEEYSTGLIYGESVQ